ncbi:MAG TPA: putative Ig domain-containing protein, partial [Candidatus Glassbacteria bacterium]|nr:putative Ig domain-containing protein [Candidatus Glassbacteria bacterium]
AFDPATKVFTFLPNFTQAGSYSVVFTATDPGGLSASQSASITVTDVNRPPKFGNLTNQTVEAGSLLEMVVTATDEDNDALTFSAVVPTGATFNATTGKLSWTPAAANAGTNPASFTVRDGKGGSDSRGITISVTVPNVVINRPPVFTPIEAKNVITGQTLSFIVTATDPDGAKPVLKVTGLPQNATFNPLTGAFAFIPAIAQAGSYTVKFSASDGLLTTELPVSITVTRGENRSPVLTGVSNQTVNARVELRFVVTASDPDGDAVTLAARNLPTGAVFSAATGGFSFTPTNEQAGAYQLTFSATDVLGAAAESTMTLTVVGVNRPPVFGQTRSIVGRVGTKLDFVISASDPDGDALTYTSPNAADLGATFNAATQMLSWTPATAGTFVVQFSVSDGKGGAATISVLATISSPTEVPNQAPVFGDVQNYVLNAGTSLSFTVLATDPDGQTLTYGILDAPRNSTFDAATRTFSFTPELTQAGTFKPTFTVSDGKLGARVKVEIEVKKVNQAPVLDAIPENRTVPERDLLHFFVTGSDPDNDPVTLSVTGLPNNAKFVPASGNFLFQPVIGQAGSYDLTFKITDPDGLSDEQAVNILVTAVNLPPALSFIDNQVTQAGQLTEVAVSATDPNDDLSELTFAATGLPGGAEFSAANRIFRWMPSAGQIGSFRVSFSVTDPSGLSSSQDIKITVEDPTRAINSPPELATVGDQTVSEGGIDVFVDPDGGALGGSSLSFQVSATDPDAGDVITLSVRGLPSGASFSSTPAAGTVSGSFSWLPGLLDAGTYELTFSASDGDFVDEEAIVLEVTELDVWPEITIPGSFYEVNVGQNLSFEVQGSDASGEAVVLSLRNPPAGAIFLPASGRFSWTPTSDQAGIFGSDYELFFEATDASGKTSGGFFRGRVSISVNDVNHPPVFQRIPNQTVAEGQQLYFRVEADDPDPFDDFLNISASGLPAGAEFGGIFGSSFVWTPS